MSAIDQKLFLNEIASFGKLPRPISSSSSAHPTPLLSTDPTSLPDEQALPDEILLFIFSFLDARTITQTIALVSHRFHHLCNDGELWYGLCVRRWRTTFEGRNFASLTRKAGRATFSPNASAPGGINFFKRAYQKEMQFRALCSPRSGAQFCTDDPTPLFERHKKMWRNPETGWSGFFAVHRATRRRVVIYESEVSDQLEREELLSYVQAMREIHEKLLDSPCIRAYYNTWIWDPFSSSFPAPHHTLRRPASLRRRRAAAPYASPHASYRVWMVMEFLDLGSLAQLMEKCQTRLLEEQIRVVAQTALQAIVSIGQLAVDHRRIDACIKASNILVNSKGDIKLSDVHGREKPNTHGVHLSLGGSPLWHAPEVIEQSGRCTPEKSWVWSLGITVIELAQGAPPHASHHPLRVLFLVSNSPPPALDPVAAGSAPWSDALHDFLAQCLTKDPTERPCAQKLLQHPWIAGAPTSVQSLRPLLQQFVDQLEASGEIFLGDDYTEDCFSPRQERTAMSAQPSAVLALSDSSNSASSNSSASNSSSESDIEESEESSSSYSIHSQSTDSESYEEDEEDEEN